MKESLNSHGQQVHQYQQTKRTITSHLKSLRLKKNHGTLEIQALDWESHKHILILAELMTILV